MLTPGALAATITVGPGQSIQAAVNGANAGDTIRVNAGTYKENVTVNKTVSLIGNGMPIIDGAGGNCAMNITANGVVLQGFNITNATDGIYIMSSNNTVSRNTANNNIGHGIFIFNSSNNIVTGNTANNSNYYGIYILNSNNNTVTGNTANDNKYGVALFNSSDNSLNGNTANENMDYGIRFDALDSNNNLTGNTANNNGIGIAIANSNNNTVTGNTANNNTNCGVFLMYSSGNDFWLNVIRGNAKSNAYLYIYDLSQNHWNSTMPLQYTYNGVVRTNYTGNYWGDYNGTDMDGDGIGDTPYHINIYKTDNYPMIFPVPDSPAPLVASFSSSVVSGMAPLTVSFTDTSTGSPVSWQWNFGDNSANVTAQNASYAYNDPGIYTVTLTVTNSTGASSTTTGQISVLQPGGQPTAYTLNLTRGWNLVSFPVVNYSVSASGLAGFGITDVAWYDNSTGGYDLFMEGISPSSYDFNLQPDRGYFVNSDRNTSLVVTGAAPAGRSTPLSGGWNLVGWSTHNSSTAKAIAGLLSGRQDIARYDTTTGAFDIYMETISPDEYSFAMHDGEGYFIDSDAGETLNYGGI